jgi:hypothetical protein
LNGVAPSQVGTGETVIPPITDASGFEIKTSISENIAAMTPGDVVTQMEISSTDNSVIGASSKQISSLGFGGNSMSGSTSAKTNPSSLNSLLMTVSSDGASKTGASSAFQNPSYTSSTSAQQTLTTQASATATPTGTASAKTTSTATSSSTSTGTTTSTTPMPVCILLLVYLIFDCLLFINLIQFVYFSPQTSQNNAVNIMIKITSMEKKGHTELVNNSLKLIAREILFYFILRGFAFVFLKVGK